MGRGDRKGRAVCVSLYVCVIVGGGGVVERNVLCVSSVLTRMYDFSFAMAWLARAWCEHLYV